MLASDLNNPNFVGATNPDSLLHVTFYMRSVQDNYRSEQEGRPIYFEVPYVRIMTPGNQLTEIDTPAREDHKQRFPVQWARFQNSQMGDEQIVGTPVEQWTAISRAQADELKALKFFTVEQVAEASDLQRQRLGMNANVLQQKAKAFLSSAKDTALQQHQAAELARKDEQIKALSDSVTKLTEQVNLLIQNRESDKPAKRKYTRRTKTSEETESA